MAGGNLRKYLVYAIGELLLVVLGILIALQINTWNEQRKERITEKELLFELYESVKRNQEILSSGIRRWGSTTRAIELISYTIEKQKPFSDSLANYFADAHQTRGNNLNGLDFSGYKALENKGFDILRNQSLRKDIVYLFEHNLPMLATSNNQLDFDNSGFHYEYITRNFIVREYKEYPIDYTRIMNDRFYFSILKRLDRNLNRKISRVKRTIDENQRVLKLLESELKLKK